VPELDRGNLAPVPIVNLREPPLIQLHQKPSAWGTALTRRQAEADHGLRAFTLGVNNNMVLRLAVPALVASSYRDGASHRGYLGALRGGRLSHLSQRRVPTKPTTYQGSP
jgi:hypothetical protein